jgi:hypothetical protein
MSIKLKNSLGDWKDVSSVYLKTSSGWKALTAAYLKTVDGWKSLLTTTLPNTNIPIMSSTNPIQIRTGSYNGPTAGLTGGSLNKKYEYIDTILYGHDGAYTNYTSISGRKFVYVNPGSGYSFSSSSTKYNLELDDILNTQTNQINADGKYVQYTLNVANGSNPNNSLNARSKPILMLKHEPVVTSQTLTSTPINPGNVLKVGDVLTYSYTLENYWYNSINKSYSWVRWYRSSDGITPGELLKNILVSNTTILNENSSSINGKTTYTVTSQDSGKYIIVIFGKYNSYTSYFNYGINNGEISHTPISTTNIINAPEIGFTVYGLDSAGRQTGLSDGIPYYETCRSNLSITTYGMSFPYWPYQTTYYIKYRIRDESTLVYYNLDGTAYPLNPNLAWQTKTGQFIYQSNPPAYVFSGTISAPAYPGVSASKVTVGYSGFGSESYQSIYIPDNFSITNPTFAGPYQKWKLFIEAGTIVNGTTTKYETSYYINGRPAIQSAMGYSANPITHGQSFSVYAYAYSWPAGAGNLAFPYAEVIQWSGPTSTSPTGTTSTSYNTSAITLNSYTDTVYSHTRNYSYPGTADFIAFIQTSAGNLPTYERLKYTDHLQIQIV